MKYGFKGAIISATIGLSVAWSQPAKAVAVGLELVLAVDVSGSINTAEYDLQKTGYVNAFNSATVQNAILGSLGGSIAVTYVEWSGNTQQSQQVGWTLIDSTTSAQSFATAISNATRAFTGGQTAPGSAIAFGDALFNGNGYEGARTVIDVSGDGVQNEGTDTATARNAALGSYTSTINGLSIGGVTIDTFYANNVVGGPGSFLVSAPTLADFGGAIQDKLVAEITPTPEPATMSLLGAGLLALGFARRRRRAA